MSEADAMFEELGYKKRLIQNICEEEIGICYYSEKESINFYYEGQKINKYLAYITMEELKAINKKCGELGWI